jgi:hypothetical protein
MEVSPFTKSPRSHDYKDRSIVSQTPESVPHHLFCPPDLLKVVIVLGNQGNFRFTFSLIWNTTVSIDRLS